MPVSRVVGARELETFVADVLGGMGAGPEVTAEVARHLVQANLCGHDSHGVLRLSQYVTALDSGDLVPPAQPRLLRSNAVTALIDAQRGFGHYSTAFALQWCLGQARKQGLAAATVRHSNHIGRLGEYVERAASSGLIGIVTVGCAGPGLGGVAPFGGSSRFLGTNPWAIGIPAAGTQPMIFDAATSALAEGKLRVARAKSVPVPAGALVDSQGEPTNNPDDYYSGGALLPLGGAVAGHKGYGFSLAAALLGALAIIDDPEPTSAGSSRRPVLPDHFAAGVLVIVIDPGVFGDAEQYGQLVRASLDQARAVPPASPGGGVMIPGEPEAVARLRNQETGIEIPEVIWMELAGIGERFSARLPA